MSHTTSRRQFVAASSAAFLQRKPAAVRPNILFVMTDDQAVSLMSCYGNRHLMTPNMDRLAAEGVRFTNAFVTNSLCAPSRATCLTGCYSHIHKVFGNSERRDQIETMDAGTPTYPELLQQAGYRTGIVGKWHLSHTPRGFDTWRILPGQGVYVNPEFIEAGKRTRYNGHVTDITTDMAIEFLEHRDQRPFCLIYQPKGPHRPFTPAERHRQMFSEIDVPVPPAFDDDYSTRKIAKEAEDMRLDVSLAEDYPDLPKGLSPPERKRWIHQRFVKDMYRSVVGIDEGLGRVLDHLDRSGQAGNTLIVYTSDNGFFLGEHGWYDKRFMYEPSLRVPLLVRFPGIAAGGFVSNAMTMNIDLAPTILDAAGVNIAPSIQGQSLRPVLEGRTPKSWRKSIYYHYYENSWAERQASKDRLADPTFAYATPHRVTPHRGVRTDRYKLIDYYTDDGYKELFDLRDDPHELRNLYTESNRQGIVGRLERELSRLRAEYRDT
ncbi:MAG: sulfatase [Bryobacteraceae bacterium]|nr:sulfatase [Bryobacteraceae bacterium]